MAKCNGDLKKLRLEAGWSQNKLARAADLDRTTISNAERGMDVSDLTLSKIVNALTEKLGKRVNQSRITK